MSIFNKIIGFYVFLVLVKRISSTDLYNGDSCPLLDGTTGVCKLQTECKWLLHELRANNISREDLLKLKCGFEGKIMVICCGDFVKKRKSEEACEMYRRERIPPLNYQITNGIRAQLGEFPHMAALGYTNEQNKQIEFRCGGSLISNRYVLTAAHCADKDDPRVVRLGTINIDNSEIDKINYGAAFDVIVESVTLHPEFKTPSRYHDIALIRLAKVVPFDRFLHPACLNTELDDSDLSSTKLIVAGWGKEGVSHNAASPFLLKTNLSIVNADDCNITTAEFINRRFSKGVILGQICANDPQGLSDTCHGDSGAPILIFDTITDNQVMPVILGVTSFGSGCGSTKPAIYGRVAFYLSWIESIVWPN